MQLYRWISRVIAVAVAGTIGIVHAQPFPNKPVRLVTVSAGGSLDFVARQIASELHLKLGQPFIVDNRTSSVIIGETVARAPADGYTLMIHSSLIWVGPLLQQTPYEVKDFLPLTMTSTIPNVLVINPGVAANSVKELIAMAKARPGELNYASGGIGSTTHLAAELFKNMAGVNIVRVPYKNSTLQITDVISGQVQMTFANASTVAPHMKSGRLRALAVTSLRPSTLTPGLPTLASAGLKGYESLTVNGVFAPAAIPPAIANLLNQQIVSFLKTPATTEKFLATGLEVAGSTSREFAAYLVSDTARWRKLIKDADIRAE
jgi:tripartite-type tricarboxylate transporter receptor subunit TctC